MGEESLLPFQFHKIYQKFLRRFNFPKNCHMVCIVPNLLGFYGTANLVSCLVAANFIVTRKLTILQCSDNYDHFMSFYDIISVEDMMPPIKTMLVTYGTTDNWLQICCCVTNHHLNPIFVVRNLNKFKA